MADETYGVPIEVINDSSKYATPVRIVGNNEYGVPVNIVGGGGGGGDGIPLLTQAQWNALTVAQKQAYGLVAIQNESSGFNCGILANGAEYVDSSYYLPRSDDSSVICIAQPDNYDSNSTSWGDRSNPIILSTPGSTQNADGSVAIKTKTDGTLAYVDLGAESTPFTAYIVAKVALANSSYTRLMSAMESRNLRRGIMLYGSTVVKVSSWGHDTAVSPTLDATSAYFVGAMNYAAPKNANGGAIASYSEPTFILRNPDVAGRYLTIGRTDINQDTNNAEPTDIDVLFFGVVDEAESDLVMTGNMLNLARIFLS